MREIHLIYNPIAGQGKSLTALNKIKEWFAVHPEFKLNLHETENVGHATSIAHDLTSTDKPVTLFLIGGDGTINEVLNGVKNFETTTIGIFPFGSGNDFVRSLNIIEPDATELINAYLLNPKVKNVDYLLLNDKYRVMNEVGLGMSAEVIALRNSMKHFGPKTQYKIATMVRSLLWKSFEYKISADKQQPAKTIKSMWFTINNGKAIGSGMITSPDSKIDDGIINVMYVNSFNRIKTLPVLMRAKKGKISTAKVSNTFTCKEIDLYGENMTVEFDGNLLEHQSHINVKIVPNKFRLLVK